MKRVILILIIAIPLFGFFRWQARVDIQSGGSGNTVVFGADSSATSGYDPGLDIPFFPPPTGAHGYFPLEDSLHPGYTMLGTDLRFPSRDTMDWDFNLGGGYGFILSWEIDELPDSGEYAIGPFDLDSLPELIVSEWTDMRSLDSVDIYLVGGRIRVIGGPVSGIDEFFASVPADCGLRVYPNPFNASCRIVPPANVAKVEIYDLRGTRVNTLESHGGHIVWNGDSESGDKLPNGIYLIRTDSDFPAIKRAVLLR